jgi:hypothetical protein
MTRGIRGVSYHTADMTRAARLCRESGEAFGISNFFLWDRDGLEGTAFYRANKDLLDEPRGSGLWAWKPHIIMDQLLDMSEGEHLIYADAGVEFIGNVRFITDRMPPGQDVWLFGNQYQHAHWCKRDVVEAIMPLTLDDAKADPATDDDSLTFGEWWQTAGWARFNKQCQASVIVVRSSERSRAFINEWLSLCLVKHLIDDSPGLVPNHLEFREHRHDQAILTTLAYRDGIPLHWWPATYNDGAFTYERGTYPDEQYPVLFHHHRRRDADWGKS